MIEGSSFAKELIDWYQNSKRNLPWRETKHAYPVWLSEIILQQTRVNQGLFYWKRFMETFPTISDLAKSSEEKVLRMWQGLGYYSRAINLYATAKHIYKNLNGIFPSSYHDLIQLKGVGPYTAAIIASICFDEPKPAVDGNVFRFASRFFGIKTDISSSRARKIFETVLKDHIDHNHPGTFNQAMMEFGATICSPVPLCRKCPLSLGCYAQVHNVQNDLPLKTKKTKIRNRFFNYLIFQSSDGLFLKRRTGKDIWRGLYDFYLIEEVLEAERVLEMIREELVIGDFTIHNISEPILHLLTHQKINIRFFEIELNDQYIESLIEKSVLNQYSIREILNLPKPKPITNYLCQLNIKP